jgi:alpha-tubulin suppressor-like RCC1 family protein
MPDTTYGQLAVPEGLSNVTVIAAAVNATFALKNDGTVAGWGDNASGQLNIPLGLTNVVAISAGIYNGFALKTDGSVVQWGNGPVWQSNGIPNQLIVAQGMSNITTVAAGWATAWSLLEDGTVRPWGAGYQWAGDIAALSAFSCSRYSFSSDYALFLRNDGTLIKSDSYVGTPQIPGNLSNVVAISAGYGHAAILVNDGTPRVARTFLNRTVHSGTKVILRSGVAGAYPMRYQWQFNGTNLDGATNVTLVMESVTLDSTGEYSCVAGNLLGSATNAAATLTVLRSAPVFKGPASLSEKGFASQLNQLAGHGNIVILASTNLVDWFPIFTNAPVTGSLLYCDPEATNQPFRFYKAVEH